MKLVASFRAVPLAALLVLISACSDSTPPLEPETIKPPPVVPPITPPVVPPVVPPAATIDSIFVAKSDGSGVVALTQGAWPSWSPDGQWIAFQRGGYLDGHVYVIRTDGSMEKQLTLGGSPAWSPDGKWIAFRNRDGIAVITADGSLMRTVVRHDFRGTFSSPGETFVSKPAWSPDSRRIAFEYTASDMDPTRVVMVEADGSNPTDLAAGNASQGEPAWSPDGKQIVFWNYFHGIMRMDVVAGGPTQLHYDSPRVYYGTRPAWSPDGNSISFSPYQSVGGSIWTISSRGSPAKLLVAGSEANWSADGTRIAFVRRK